MTDETKPTITPAPIAGAIAAKPPLPQIGSTEPAIFTRSDVQTLIADAVKQAAQGSGSMTTPEQASFLATTDGPRAVDKPYWQSIYTHADSTLVMFLAGGARLQHRGRREINEVFVPGLTPDDLPELPWDLPAIRERYRANNSEMPDFVLEWRELFAGADSDLVMFLPNKLGAWFMTRGEQSSCACFIKGVGREDLPPLPW